MTMFRFHAYALRSYGETMYSVDLANDTIDVTRHVVAKLFE